MQQSMRPFAAAAVAVLMLAAAALLSWMVVTSGVLSATPAAADTPASAQPASPVVEVQPAAPPAAVVSGGFQVSQPRDPFKPLVDEDSPVDDGGVGGPGDDDNGNGTDTASKVTLVQVRDVSGVMRATMEVNGVRYDVGVGETFAVSYKVISLEVDSGVFTLGDKAFELSVGQEILK